jgi:cell division septation protein DedD
MTPRPTTAITIFRVLACFATIGLLAACSSGRPVNPVQEANNYAAHAKRNYTPPGPPGDPWGPYIREAAGHYDVPERWVREVVRQESGGQQYENGQLIISSAGAMGLMQVMPETYDELRARYGLGSDPYDPHDNIMAGTAYVREMYNVYGYPGFLAAYNAGPARLDDYLMHSKPLPEETRRYVARVGRAIQGTYPMVASAADQTALYRLPLDIPAGPRYPKTRQAPVALASNSRQASYSRVAVAQAALPEPPRPVAPPPVAVAAAEPPAKHGFRLISQAYAEPAPLPRSAAGAGGWAIQVGAFASEAQARSATDAARDHLRDLLHGAKPAIGSVHQAHATLYRARLTGLSHEGATQACQKLSHTRGACIVLSPESQS